MFHYLFIFLILTLSPFIYHHDTIHMQNLISLALILLILVFFLFSYKSKKMYINNMYIYILFFILVYTVLTSLRYINITHENIFFIMLIIMSIIFKITVINKKKFVNDIVVVISCFAIFNILTFILVNILGLIDPIILSNYIGMVNENMTIFGYNFYRIHISFIAPSTLATVTLFTIVLSDIYNLKKYKYILLFNLLISFSMISIIFLLLYLFFKFIRFINISFIIISIMLMEVLTYNIMTNGNIDNISTNNISTNNTAINKTTSSLQRMSFVNTSLSYMYNDPFGLYFKDIKQDDEDISVSGLRVMTGYLPTSINIGGILLFITYLCCIYILDSRLYKYKKKLNLPLIRTLIVYVSIISSEGLISLFAILILISFYEDFNINRRTCVTN